MIERCYVCGGIVYPGGHTADGDPVAWHKRAWRWPLGHHEVLKCAPCGAQLSEEATKPGDG